MSIRRSPLLTIVCVLGTLSGYGCDDNGNNEPRADRLSPSPISFNGLGQSTTSSIDYYAHGVTLQPAVVIPQLAPSAACPTRPPLLAPIRVVVNADADSDLFLNEVQINFMDCAGGFGESVKLDGSRLVELFGSTRIPRLSNRSFPFTFPFGCTGEATGTLNVFVFTGDSSGHKTRSSSSITIR